MAKVRQPEWLEGIAADARVAPATVYAACGGKHGLLHTLWFYFGYSSYFTLTDENKWTLAKAEKWLLGQACSALL